MNIDMDHQIQTELAKINEYISKQAVLKKEILNLTEAALYAGISKSYLYKMTSKRKIPFYRPDSKLIFFKRLELDDWLLKNRMPTVVSELSEESSTRKKT